VDHQDHPYSHTPRNGPRSDRNSDVAAWVEFAGRLDPEVYFVVFIRDTEKVFSATADEMGGFTLFNEAAWNLDLRMAFYELCYLNIGINNGPLQMAMLNPSTACLMFKFMVESVSETNADQIKKIGLSIGEQLPYLNDKQRVVWEPDTADIIEREFLAMCRQLDGPGPGI